MPSRSEPPVEYDSLAELLKALANPVRLELLDVLRMPRMVGEIKVSPQRLQEGDNPERPASRQALQAHLDRLVAADLVREDRVQVGDRSLRRYGVNAQKLYVVTEEMRRLSTFHAHRGGDALTTSDADLTTHAPTPRVRGPRLVLVHGVFEGKVFRLDEADAPAGRWLIGRSRTADVSLAYDPFVSAENTIIERREGAFTVTDLEGSRNGTRVNWEPLPTGLPRALETGDVIGVGRSLLSFIAR